MNVIDRYRTEEARWNAVKRRDRRAQGAFLYAVKTTGVFCRPACPSRLPNRRNVEFFNTSESAVKKGYRACKKCQPTCQRTAVPSAVVTACRLMIEADEPLSLTALAKRVGLSPFHFHRLFKTVLGITPKAYASALRDERLREQLKTEPTITQAIFGAGFSSSSRYYEQAGSTLGMTPKEFRSGAVGKSIRFAVAECRLGWLAIAATERGLCLVEFGESSQALRAEVAARFPNASIVAGDAEFQQWVKQVVQQIDAPGPRFDLPLDIQGTAFQRKVWEALRTIPAGTTTTYARLAQAIDQPTAVRAVARACAANPLAVVVPCHRIVRSDGKLSGYRWGVSRKRELLKMEARERSGGIASQAAKR